MKLIKGLVVALWVGVLYAAMMSLWTWRYCRNYTELAKHDGDGLSFCACFVISEITEVAQIVGSYLVACAVFYACSVTLALVNWAST